VALVTTASPRVNTGFSQLTLQSGNSAATVNTLPGGQYKITARYGGDSVFAPSTSTPVSVNINPEGSTLSVFGNYLSYASNSFVPVSNGGSYPYATYIAIDAQLRGASAPQGALDGVATGFVTFTDAASAGTASSGALNIDTQGVAEWVPATALALGTHSVSAAYSGDPSFNASSSPTPLNFTITKAVPTAMLSANPTTIGLGSSTTLTLVVAIETATMAAPATGTATFYFGNSVLGTAALATNPNAQGPAASLNVSSLPLGNDSVTASYSGDGNYDAATSAPVRISVLEPSNLTATANPSSINLTGSTVVTATVPGVSGLPAPTGYVTFGTSNYFCGANNLVNGSASCTFSGNSLGVGNDSIGVGYSGDSNYTPASVTVLVNDTMPFTLSATAVVIAAPGATTGNTSTVTVTPQSGFIGAVSLSCVLTSSPHGAQDLPTCTIPSSVNITATSPVTVTMTINSTAAGTAAAIHSVGEDRLWLEATAGMVLGAFFVLGMPAGRRGRCRLVSFFTIGLLVLLVGCGGGNGGGGGGTAIPGTTLGSYTFAVQGSFDGANQPQTFIGTVTIQ
jgi:Bacterial Ig-like domain (group 3)